MIPESPRAATIEAAWSVAREAASRAGVEVRELQSSEIAIAQEVIGAVWGPQQIPQSNLLRAFAHAGSTLLGALVDDRPVGTTLGFLGWEGGLHLHSHMTAVIPTRLSGGVGYALKLWQRAVCLREGFGEIRWTYDPLVARNAQFNLVKLGAVVMTMHPNFYGAMDDIVNAGEESDRFEVSWRLELATRARGRGRPSTPASRRGALASHSDGLHDAFSHRSCCSARGAHSSARCRACG